MDRRTFFALNAFSEIVAKRSFTRAAAHLGVTPSALSQAIKQLEDDVGVRLLHRTTRSVAPSQAGEQLLARLGPTLSDLDAALADVAATASSAPSGRLRISLSRICGELVVGPRLGAFAEAYPDVQLELIVDDHFVDIVAGRFDAGIRLGESLAKDMIGVEVGGKQRLIVVATPGYWAVHGKPKHPRDLLAHRCVLSLYPGGEVYRWELEKDGTEIELAITGPIATNDPMLAQHAVLAGAGCAFAFEQQCATYLADGTLDAVLPAWCPRFPGFHLYYPSRKITPALRAFIDTLKRR